MYSPDKIGQKLRSIREAKGYSQEYIASMMDVSQSTYASWESGKTALRMDRLIRILDILDTDVTTLFESKENGMPKDASFPEIRKVYEQMIEEMREEIVFLRGLVNGRN